MRLAKRLGAGGPVYLTAVLEYSAWPRARRVTARPRRARREPAAAALPGVRACVAQGSGG